MVKKTKLKLALQGRLRAQDKVNDALKKEQLAIQTAAAKNHKAKAVVKKTQPFSVDDRVLTVGEGNLSFTLALVRTHNIPAAQIIATSFDSEETIAIKYPDAVAITQDLRDAGVQVLFGVDGGNLGGVKELKDKLGHFTQIVFNFPHVGSGEKDQDRNIALNQAMILRFLRSAGPFLAKGTSRARALSTGKAKSKGKGKQRHKHEEDDEDKQDAPLVSDDEEMDQQEVGQKGTILITLRDRHPYTAWKMPRLLTHPPALPPLSSIAPADRPPPNTSLPLTQPRYTIIRSFVFHSTLYPGYAHRRTIGFVEGVSKDDSLEIDERGGGRTWEAEVVEESLHEELKPTATSERMSRIEERKRELRAEKKRGNGWKDKRPDWEAPDQLDAGYSG